MDLKCLPICCLVSLDKTQHITAHCYKRFLHLCKPQKQEIQPLGAIFRFVQLQLILLGLCGR